MKRNTDRHPHRFQNISLLDGKNEAQFVLISLRGRLYGIKMYTSNQFRLYSVASMVSYRMRKALTCQLYIGWNNQYWWTNEWRCIEYAENTIPMKYWCFRDYDSEETSFLLNNVFSKFYYVVFDPFLILWWNELSNIALSLHELPKFHVYALSLLKQAYKSFVSAHTNFII